MSVGPMGMAGSVAGTHLPQARGTETDRNQQEGSIQQRQTQGQAQAEAASGVGQTGEDEQLSERDADGRRLWEKTPPRSESEEAVAEEAPLCSRDASGQRGRHLDLSG